MSNPVAPPWQQSKPVAFSVYLGEPIPEPDTLEFRVLDAAGALVSGWADAVRVEDSAVYRADSFDISSASPGRIAVEWRFVPYAGGPTLTWTTAWDTDRVPSPSPVYALVSDLRDEGVTETVASTARLRSLILLASVEVGRITGRTFGAYHRTLLLDGRGANRLLLDEPILSVDELVVGAESLTSDEVGLEPSSFRVYNRHVSEGLASPDDRENPKIEFRGDPLDYGFTRGSQNIRLRGVFGYTEFDGSPCGGVPQLITRTTLLLAARLSQKIGDASSGFGDASSWKVVEEQTRDQRVRYADLGSTAATKSGTSLRGAFTGDPEIDTILASYCRGPRFGAV